MSNSKEIVGKKDLILIHTLILLEGRTCLYIWISVGAPGSLEPSLDSAGSNFERTDWENVKSERVSMLIVLNEYCVCALVCPTDI